jgi:hypothetical protein
MNDTRVSAAGLVRIVLDDKYLLCLNKKRRESGNFVYSPFGGGLEFDEVGKKFLDTIVTSYESGPDLRLQVPESKIDEFSSWFSKKINRDVCPFRELNEEFVCEEKIFSNLRSEDVLISEIGTNISSVITDRPGQNGKLTKRYLELFDCEFVPELKYKIYLELANKNSNLYLASEFEIKNQVTNKGIKIADNCAYLLK